MAITVEMPRLSDTMEEGTLVKWQVEVGDEVEAGQVLADVETDKATMELTAFDDGKVAKLVAGEGDTMEVGAAILILAEEGESLEDAAASGGGKSGSTAAGPSDSDESDEEQDAEDTGEAEEESGEKKEPEKKEEPEAEEASTDKSQASGGGGGGRVRISPVARKIADEKGVDVSSIKGSGPDGRIIKRDVLAAAEGKGEKKSEPRQDQSKKSARTEAPSPAPAPKLEAKTHELSNMRKTIAKRLLESKTTIPHFTVTVSINMDPLLTLRKTLNDQLESQGVKLSVNDFIVRGVALSLVQHPMVNASWQDGSIQTFDTVNVGVAVALPEDKGGGLVVPTLRDCQNKGLRQISQETRQLAEKARESGLSLEEMSDGTFTLSNLGMFGVEHFEAIINPPQAAILAVGAAIEKPVVRDGQIVVGREMSATISADHRVVDGAMAAEYLQTLQQMLENPAVLMV